ncbi:Ada metal-binding domain-containing protein [Cohnella thailandensis]|uniref:Methylphosphotriester-DNA--protein-cysteine methyltransferase family protein n=1 Tax=Cohnella thailandensis TaxID=557557 RepID=A0A841SQU3_9BACL|nr:methylphosphotriester-DNA--protein-cysteine methyltransferase family protein [Cohnella thailandensis]MBP1975330.1 AraC family transcriptional regulator of adaptative response / methylphosphotriester-DNA alkyltransferase methyltransferase [Cohnella thailandensis]
MNDDIQEGLILTEERWQAILRNDAAFDHRFYYAVRTTGIFCRPSCKSKPPKKENVRIFANAAQAMREEFRPCKRCKPNGERLPDEEWADQIARYIDKHYAETITLEMLADLCHGSPYHLQRTFKRVKGISPVEYLQKKRMAEAKKSLLETDKALSAIASSVGFSSASYFTTLFKRMTGRTPARYRQWNADRTNLEGREHEQTP